MPAGSIPIETQSLLDELRELQDQRAQLEQEQLDIEKQLGDAKVEVGEAASDHGYDRQEEERLRVAARARENELKHADQKRREFDNQIKKFGDDLGVIYQRCVSSQDLTNFLWWKYARDLAQAAFMGALQAYCELRNAGGEILRSFHAACMKMGAAILGTGTQVSVQFTPWRYLQIPDGMPQAPLEQDAKTRSEWREYQTQVDKFNELKADRFNDDEIKRAEDELSASEREHAAAQAAKKAAKHREEEMRAAFNDHRAKFARIQEEMQALERRKREIEAELQKAASQRNRPG
jgi:chromosome segregation ATPase